MAVFYPPTYDTDSVKATSRVTSDYEPWFAVDPSLSLTGTPSGTQWQSGSSQVTNQKFNVAFSTPFVLTSLTIENSHSTGGSTNVGVDNVLVYGTNSSTAFENTTHATTTDLTLIDTIEVAEHTASDTSDPETFTITGNTTAYQYYVFRIADNHGNASYMGLREVTFTGTLPIEIDEIVGGLGFGGSMTIGGSGVDLGGGLGFGGTMQITSASLVMNGGLGFGGSMDLVTELPIVLNSGLGFGGTIAITRQTDIQMGGGLGFGGGVTMDNSNNLTMSGSIKFGGVMTLTALQDMQMNGGLGFGGTMQLSGPGETGYTECELPAFNSGRWC